MKKIIIVFVMLISIGTIKSQADLAWFSQAGWDDIGGDVYQSNGSLVPIDSDWLIALVSTNDYASISDLNDTTTALYTTTDGFSSGMVTGDGRFYQEGVIMDDSWQNLTVFAVLYNASQKINATEFALFSVENTFGTWGMIPASEEFNFDGVTSQTGPGLGQWQAIPEPAVAGLISIFGFGLIGVRRIFFK